MSAGTDLNLRLAAALGWWCREDGEYPDVWKAASGRLMITHQLHGEHAVWDPAGSWADAGALLEEMARRGWEPALNGDPGPPYKWSAAFMRPLDPARPKGPKTVYHVFEEIGPAAIAGAALRALQGAALEAARARSTGGREPEGE